MVVKRDHTHAGSWYSSNGSTLSAQLDEWLDEVPDNVPDTGGLPKEGARTIIAPYALLVSCWKATLTICVAMLDTPIPDLQLHGHTKALIYPGRRTPHEQSLVHSTNIG